jgi:hypothetical protein
MRTSLSARQYQHGRSGYCSGAWLITMRLRPLHLLLESTAIPGGGLSATRGSVGWAFSKGMREQLGSCVYRPLFALWLL